MYPPSIYNSESRCADTQRQSDWMLKGLCACVNTHTNTCATWKHAYTQTYTHTLTQHWKPFYSVGACMRAHIHGKDLPLQLAAGTHTDIQTLVSIQATQTHFQVFSNVKADMLFTISASSSPLRVEQIHTHHQILCNTSLKWSAALNKSTDLVLTQVLHRRLQTSCKQLFTQRPVTIFYASNSEVKKRQAGGGKASQGNLYPQ